MSRIEKFDILEIILDVLIVNKVEAITNNEKITDSILCFKYIIHLFLTNITGFLIKFKPTHTKLLRSKDSVRYTTIIRSREILKTLLGENINPFISLVAENPFIVFDIDKFFKDNFFIDNFNTTDNGIRMKKRGLIYFIKKGERGGFFYFLDSQIFIKIKL